jgi:hypothetical protein
VWGRDRVRGLAAPLDWGGRPLWGCGEEEATGGMRRRGCGERAKPMLAGGRGPGYQTGRDRYFSPSRI